MRSPAPIARFGQVWTVGYAKRPASPPPEPYLIVSGDMYNDAGLGFIGVQVLAGEKAGALYEPLPGLGTAQFDMIAWYPPGWLVEHVGDLDPARHGTVARVIRNLIGND